MPALLVRDFSMVGRYAAPTRCYGSMSCFELRYPRHHISISTNLSALESHSMQILLVLAYRWPLTVSNSKVRWQLKNYAIGAASDRNGEATKKF